MTTGTWLTALLDAMMRDSHHTLTNDLTIWDDLKRFRSVREQSHEFIEFFFTRRCLHLLAFIASSFSLHFVCLICRKIIGHLGLVVVPILTYSHVFPSINIPHTTMHLYRITHQLFTSHDHTHSLARFFVSRNKDITFRLCSPFYDRNPIDSIIHHHDSLLQHLTTTKK